MLAAAQKKFGVDLETPNDLSLPEYEAVYLYKAAVEKAGSTDSAKVMAALPTVSFTGPRGVAHMETQHHAPLTMYLGQMQDDGSGEIDDAGPAEPGARARVLNHISLWNRG